MQSPSMLGLPTCSCGHDRYHHAVRADLKFGSGSWIVIMNGVSGTPKQIAFKCAACNETFEITRDTTVLRQFRRYPYVNRTAK